MTRERTVDPFALAIGLKFSARRYEGSRWRSYVFYGFLTYPRNGQRRRDGSFEPSAAPHRRVRSSASPAFALAPPPTSPAVNIAASAWFFAAPATCFTCRFAEWTADFPVTFGPYGRFAQKGQRSRTRSARHHRAASYESYSWVFTLKRLSVRAASMRPVPSSPHHGAS